MEDDLRVYDINGEYLGTFDEEIGTDEEDEA